MAVTIRYRNLWIFLGAVISLVTWNEFLVYYFLLLQCNWPVLHSTDTDFREYFQFPAEKEPLRAMFIADTHLLGSNGHWFDKLRREWQMYRSFQSALFLFNPEVVFILGDLLDEGKWSSDEEFEETVKRFNKIFKHPLSSKMQVVVGNHDIGFHYMVSKAKRNRFNNAFETSVVNSIKIKGNIFVMLNSMAFEGDHCSMCAEAEEKLQQLSHSLNCAQGGPEPSACINEEKFLYSRPIILQHFPMHRKDDSDCSGPDSAPPSEKYVYMVPKKDCLSFDATEKILNLIKPRLVIDGHTHNYCERTLSDGTPEFTIPSFNWRNKQNPSFLLGRISNDNHALNKCFIPNESTVIWTYVLCGIAITLWLILPLTFLGGTNKLTSDHIISTKKQ